MSRKRSYWDNEPFFMRSKFRSTCSESGQVIQKGEMIAYWPIGKKVFKVGTKGYSELEQKQFCETMGII